MTTRTAPNTQGQPITNPIIRTMMAQMGGTGLRGAFVYVGTSAMTHKAHADYGYPPHRSHVTPEGLIQYDTGLTISVNGKRRRDWKIVVAYEPNDTYTVYLWQRPTPKETAATGKTGEILDKSSHVYFDQLQEVVENMYDEAIRKYNDGFIPCH